MTQQALAVGSAITFDAGAPSPGAFGADLSAAELGLARVIEARDRFIAAFNWLWDYVTFQRGARLITEVPSAERNRQC